MLSVSNLNFVTTYISPKSPLRLGRSRRLLQIKEEEEENFVPKRKPESRCGPAYALFIFLIEPDPPAAPPPPRNRPRRTPYGKSMRWVTRLIRVSCHLRKASSQTWTTLKTPSTRCFLAGSLRRRCSRPSSLLLACTPRLCICGG